MKEGGRSESDKERTKMRERQRRGITTKIFNGLRKHGGYQLSPRADINEVLRELAKEAGWVVDPDGTTYRSFKGVNCCPVCGVAKTSATPIPTSSVVIGGCGGVGGGGECSTTASPRRMPIGEPTVDDNMNISADMFLVGGTHHELYLYGGLAGGSHLASSASASASTTTSGDGDGGLSVVAAMGYQQQQAYYLQEAKASFR